MVYCSPSCSVIYQDLWSSCGPEPCLRGLWTASGDDLALRRLSERKNESDAGERVPAGRESEGGVVEPPTVGFFAGIVASYWPTGALQRVILPKKEIEDSLFALNSCCQKTHSTASGTHYYSQHAFVVSQHFSDLLLCHTVCPNLNCRFFLSVVYFLQEK